HDAPPATRGRPAPGGPEAAALATGRHEQERWALTLIRQVWPRCDLLSGRAPLLDVGDGEPQSKQHVDIGRDGPVLLDHTLGKPIRRASAFFQIAVDRPRLTTRGIEGPLRVGGSRENRMLYREDEAPTRDERTVHGRQK